ncbi:MAG TPA: UDP-3-O-acyl-N-acetylglucosamine deacetylase [Gemmatimonadaceae bacterium]|nr:UDP-3-O-acyl-N-acetylglucosamine deacetylase [Gemmatimonadaceae bacterium]
MTRRTIAREASLDGVGLHLGSAVRLTFRPARSGSGIAFRRVDLAGEPVIPATAEHAVLTERRTQLGVDPVSVHTVEHVLAAIVGAGIDDVMIDLNAAEPPIMDGSAGPFLSALVAAGATEQPGARCELAIRTVVRVVDGEAVYEAHPAPRLELDVTIDFPHPLIGTQRCALTVTDAAFAAELARARTFGFVQEVEMLRTRGLIKGGSTDNAVVLDESGPIGTSLRWPDEFARHKALDCVGDLALCGARVRGRVVALRPSHRGTLLLVRAMMEAATKETTVLGIDEIMKVLPHRYPFLLVDRIVEVEAGRRIVGIKNVTINEPFFQGHFPGHPIMPGVLIIEAMAQVGGMLLMGSVPSPETKVVYFTSLDNVKWRRPVKPGDQLRFELDLLQVRGTVAKMRGVARVDGETVCEAEMGAMVRDR